MAEQFGNFLSAHQSTPIKRKGLPFLIFYFYFNHVSMVRFLEVGYKNLDTSARSPSSLAKCWFSIPMQDCIWNWLPSEDWSTGVSIRVNWFLLIAHPSPPQCPPPPQSPVSVSVCAAETKICSETSEPKSFQERTTVCDQRLEFGDSHGRLLTSWHSGAEEH